MTTVEQLNSQIHGGVNFRKADGSEAKSGHRINFHGVAACPTCKYPLSLNWIEEDSWPYAHCDFDLTCRKCGWGGTFGVATNPLFGMELIIWDSQPLDVLKQALKLDQPICPFHHQKMRVTKIWGDKVMEPPGFIRVQWKCPEWFLTEHKTVKRLKPSPIKAVSKKQEVMRTRLKQLGYM